MMKGRGDGGGSGGCGGGGGGNLMNIVWYRDQSIQFNSILYFVSRVVNPVGPLPSGR